jgi:hypothetical protein
VAIFYYPTVSIDFPTLYGLLSNMKVVTGSPLGAFAFFVPKSKKYSGYTK